MDETTILSAVIGVWAFGFVSLTAIVVERGWKWGLSATIGLGAAILIDVHSGQEAWLRFLRDMAIGAAGGLSAGRGAGVDC